MDSIDALGSRPDRHVAFSRELLAEAEDDELKAIVDQAAHELNAPIAMVNLVLDHIQFFKAHHGLPPDLVATRATERSVSFCQFVVRDGQPFEVTDAEHDTRVPQHLVKTYGIKSYLGMPVVANDVVLGDRRVNRKIRDIDHMCHAFIVRHAPSAGHLRYVSAVLRLEKLGVLKRSVGAPGTFRVVQP